MGKRYVTRRDFLKVSAATAAGLALSACGPAATTLAPTSAPVATATAAAKLGRAIKIGYVSPQTGPLAGFGEADNFILSGVKSVFADGLSVSGVKHPVEIVVQDSQSDPNKATEVAADLILKDNIDLMVVSSTPETTNPVSDQCEVNGVPCISTVAPWQPWFIGRGGKPGETEFKWTYHFFWGLEDIIGVFLSIWDTLGTNKVVGGMWPNDGDGLAWSSDQVGFPAALTPKGYTIVDPGRYQNGKDDFSAELSMFKDQQAEIVTGVMIPPDLGTFLTQANQQGFVPKAMTVGKAALFPSAVEAIGGGLGDGLTTEVWWSPSHPFKSSLTKASAKELAEAYQKDTSKQWTQPIGFVHALFEVAADTLSRTTNLDDKSTIAAALKATNLNTIVGPIAFTGQPVPNVAKTPLVGGQWGKGQTFPFEMTIVHSDYADIPVGGKARLMPGS